MSFVRRFPLRFAFALGVLFPLALPASQLIDNLDAGLGQTVVLYGTSETQFGRWADTVPGHGGLSDWLAGLYGSKATVINSGMSGKASNTGVASLDSKVLAFHPDTVIIEFGINDANTNYLPTVDDFDISVAESKANLNTMIDAILAADPDTEIILQTMTHAFDIGHYLNGTYRPELNAYYQNYRDVAAERGLLLVDHYQNWMALQASDPSLVATYIPDGLHPTAPASLAITLPYLERQLLASTIPEPAASAALGAAGAAGLAGLRRRRRAS